MTGIFDVIGTPQERQEKVLRHALEMRVAGWREEGYVYRSAGDLLLQHGRFFTGRALPEEYLDVKGVPGRCFMNALDACKARPELRYYEGVYAVGDEHYTPHAWCIDPDGELLEVSLSTDPEVIGKATRTNGLPVLGVEHWGYWGVEFHPELVEFVIEAQEGACGILDRPKADALGGDPLTAEWRNEWPILRVPYDVDRRSL